MVIETNLIQKNVAPLNSLSLSPVMSGLCSSQRDMISLPPDPQ